MWNIKVNDLNLIYIKKKLLFHHYLYIQSYKYEGIK